MWNVILNEWIALRRNKWLFTLTASFMVLLVVTVSLGKREYEKKRETFELATKHLREQWESIQSMNPHSAAHYGTYIFKPTTVLGMIDDGVSSVTGNVQRIEGHVQNEMVHSEASQSMFVSRFGKLKSSLLLQYIVPILLIFMSFRAVNSEKQSGRLKLLLLQGVSPRNLLGTKALFVWLYGVALLLLTVAVFAFYSGVQFNGSLLPRLATMVLAHAFYYCILIVLTVYISARWESVTAVLSTMLSVWILWTIFIPNIAMSAVENKYELPSRKAFKTAMSEDRSKGIDGHNSEDERIEELKQKVLAEYGVSSVEELPINFDGLLMQADEEVGNDVWDRHFGNIREVLAKQKRAYQLAGLANPFIALQNSSKGFAGNDNFHHQDFLLQAESYRRTLLKTLNDEHAFGGSKTGDWGWQANNEFFTSIEDFHYQNPSYGNVLKNYIFDLAVLLGWTLITLGLLLFPHLKMNV